jgi:hypothetical protein
MDLSTLPFSPSRMFTMIVWVINAAYGMGGFRVSSRSKNIKMIAAGRWLIGDARSAKIVPNAASFQNYNQSRTLGTHQGHPKGLPSPPIPPSHVNPVSGHVFTDSQRSSPVSNIRRCKRPCRICRFCRNYFV